MRPSFIVNGLSPKFTVQTTPFSNRLEKPCLDYNITTNDIVGSSR